MYGDCKHICTDCEGIGCSWHEEMEWLQEQQELCKPQKSTAFKTVLNMISDKQKAKQMLNDGRSIADIESTGIKFSNADATVQ